MADYNLQSLNDEQILAVKDTEGAVLVTAGAGSGKTRVLTHRIAYLIKERAIKPYNILAITFTNKAASEMKHRLAEMVVGAELVWVSTFHSMCVSILRKNADVIKGYTKNFTIYDQTDRTRILKEILKSKNINEDGFREKVDWHISNCKNKNLSVAEYEIEYESTTDMEDIAVIMREYEKKMASNNALDFDSLLTKTYYLLSTNEVVRKRYQNKFQYIHIDEFQDTNKVQYDLAKILAGEWGNIFVVGDEDQSIYTWRGADFNNIFNFTKDFKTDKTYKLEQNYRSTKNILDAANLIIKTNKKRLDKKLWTDKKGGVRIEYFQSYNEKQEADYVAQRIHSLVRDGSCKYSDIAVLMRLNALTRSFEESLMLNNIPYRVFGGMKFYDRKEIKDVMAYLKLAANIKDDESFRRVINLPKRGIGGAAILKLSNLPGDKSLMEKVLELDENSELPKAMKIKFLNFKDMFNGILSIAPSVPTEVALDEFLEMVLKSSKVLEFYKSSSKEEDISRAYNINEYLASVQEYCKANPNLGLSEYLQSVSLISDIDSYEDAEDTVTLATVHSVKGLEFRTVFIVGLEDKIFPLKRKDTTNEDEEEERRLMYVAITRAMKRLYLVHCQTRFLYGERKYAEASIFLKELGYIKPSQSYQSDYNSEGKTNFMKIGSTSASESIPSSNKTSTSASLNKVLETKMSKAKKDYSAFVVGSKVLHPKFGIGTITATDFSGTSKSISVNFNNIGVKTLALEFAPLQVLKGAK